jgi:hypothetical protein
VMLHGHHAAARTARGSDQDAWVISGKQGWVSSRERRSSARDEMVHGVPAIRKAVLTRL